MKFIFNNMSARFLTTNSTSSNGIIALESEDSSTETTVENRITTKTASSCDT